MVGGGFGGVGAPWLGFPSLRRRHPEGQETGEEDPLLQDDGDPPPRTEILTVRPTHLGGSGDRGKNEPVVGVGTRPRSRSSSSTSSSSRVF